MKRLAALSFIMSMMVVPALADEIRPAYLELNASGPATYDLRWKIPVRGGRRLGIQPQLPGKCVVDGSILTYVDRTSETDIWRVRCPRGLAGETIGIAGLSSTQTDALVRLTHDDGATEVARLTGSDPSFVVAPVPTPSATARAYVLLGVEHIITGLDHLLFVLVLMMLVRGWRRLVATITAFTLAHSITLVAATLGLIFVPQQFVEALIALSIAFAAAEVVSTRRRAGEVAWSRSIVLASTFGLLHGFGFADALLEIGIPEQAVPLSLLFFNIGVEIGQLLFIAFMLVVAGIARRVGLSRSASVRRAAVYPIGIVAIFWTLERVAAF